ncbi:MAG: hypothetical protein R2867_07840 [Caldilineaceae bacterium]
MKHKLISFYGASPGAGKSTLSAQLQRQLQQHNLPVRWLYEDDVDHLELFKPVMEHMRGESNLSMPDACLAATANLVAAHADNNTIVITDSILPYYDWLLAANYDETVIKVFSRKLVEQLRPLHPLIVYLQADTATVLQRAVKQRGKPWLHDLITFMNCWNANKAQPITNLADVVAYFQWTDNKKAQYLLECAGDLLWLNSTADSLEECMLQLLDYLELTPLAKQCATLSEDDLKLYVGSYQTDDDQPPDGRQTIVITLLKGELWVDLYWPNGCRLVAENQYSFQLADTSHRLIFTELTAESKRCLYYHYGGKSYTYHAVSS